MIRLVALALTVLTGFSGLVYEVTWQRYLAILLGSHGEATAAVLGIFLGGLAVGYTAFGSITGAMVARARRAGTPPRLLGLYGVVEAGIGVYALAFPLLFQGVQRISLALPMDSPGLGFAADVALTALLIGPPTVLMGGTIPVLTQALARTLDDATRVHAWVYACNTAGAFLGALAAGFVLVPRLGLVGVVWAMGAVNLAAGAIFLVLGRRSEGAPASLPEADATARVPGFAIFAAVAVLAGFAMMAVQTTLNRLGALALGSSQFTFAMVVAVFVLCIALGSFAVSALPRVRAWHLVASHWTLVLLLYLLYTPLGNLVYWAHLLRIGFRDHVLAFYFHQLAVFLALLAVFAVPIGLSGAFLPLLFHHLRQTVGDLGATAGRLYGWNTLGSLLGALLGGYALLFVLDLHAVYRLSVAALALGAFLLTIRLVERSAGIAGALLLLPVLGALVLQPAWEPLRLSSGLYRVRQPEPFSGLGPDRFFERQLRDTANRFYDDGPAASIAVQEVATGRGGERQLAIISNGKSDGATVVDYPTMVLIGLLPALFAEGCERSFVIGFGTGVTAGELGALACSREVLVAEIASGVIEAAPLFDPYNHDASRNPKIRLVREDAYRTLLRSERRFDVIASEPSNPWVVGVESLYSREFLEAARARLRPGGVYAQWFHIYEMDTRTASLVLETFRSVFEHSSLWFTAGADVVILGFDRSQDALDLDRLLRRMDRPDFREALARADVRGPEALLAHEILPEGVIRRARLGGRIHELLRPVLGYDAALAFFQGGGAPLPFTGTSGAAEAGRENSLLRRFLRTSEGAPSEAQLASVAGPVCRSGRLECEAVLAWWWRQEPDAARREALVAKLRSGMRREIPPGLLEQLAGFFDGAGGAVGDLTPADASKADESFRRFYHHAFPFEAAARERIWSRCRDGAEAGSCARARREAGAG